MATAIEKLLRLQREREEKAKAKRIRELSRAYKEPLVAKHLKQCVKDAGGIIIKMHPLTDKGIPDYLVFVHKRAFFVETKSTGEHCTPAQLEYQKLLKSQGIETYVLDTKIVNFYDLYVRAYKTYVDPDDRRWGINRVRLEKV